jgi:3-phosphoglycerate kinase
MIKVGGRALAKLKSRDLCGRRVLLRLDLNVPIEHGEVKETFRLDQSLPTIKMLSDAGATVIILAHLGSAGASLAPVARYLNSKIRTTFLTNAEDFKYLNDAPAGSVFLLENLRQDPREEKNSIDFARELAAMGDLYVNEAFSVSHREHASVSALPKLLPSYFGPLFVREVEQLSRAFGTASPFVLIIGGAKFSTKIPLVKKFLTKADEIFVGGAIANSFFKQQGLTIGRSLVDDKLRGLGSYLKIKKFHLPLDVAGENKGMIFAKAPTEVKKDDVILDVGPETVLMIKEAIAKAKFVLWNGPLGNFERGFGRATLDVAQALAASKAFSIVGGGDTIAAISHLGLGDKIGFLSTGGGAMLDFLATGNLPGIKAVLSSKKKLTVRKIVKVK